MQEAKFLKIAYPVHGYRLASFPGLSWFQFLIACSIRFCILQVTKNWSQERPGNEARYRFVTNKGFLDTTSRQCSLWGILCSVSPTSGQKVVFCLPIKFLLQF